MKKKYDIECARILKKEPQDRTYKEMNTLVEYMKHTSFFKDLEMELNQMKKVAR